MQYTDINQSIPLSAVFKYDVLKKGNYSLKNGAKRLVPRIFSLKYIKINPVSRNAKKSLMCVLLKQEHII